MQVERATSTKVNTADSVAAILETDRVWSAYALADMHPPVNEHADWYPEEDAVVLVYRGLSPPVLFAHGHPLRVRQALERVPPGRYLYTLRGTDRAAIRPALVIEHEMQMWRMHLHPRGFPPDMAVDAVRLGRGDLDQIMELMGDHADRPDAFHPDQLANGVYFGFRMGGLGGIELISRDGPAPPGTGAVVVQ